VLQAIGTTLISLLQPIASSSSASGNHAHVVLRLLALLEGVHPTANWGIIATCVVRPLVTAAVGMVLAVPSSQMGADLLAALLRQDYITGDLASSPSGQAELARFCPVLGQRRRNSHVIAGGIPEDVTLVQLASAALSTASPAVPPSYAEMLWQVLRSSQEPSTDWQSLVNFLSSAPEEQSQHSDGMFRCPFSMQAPYMLNLLKVVVTDSRMC